MAYSQIIKKRLIKSMEEKIYTYNLHIVKNNLKTPLEDFTIIPESTLGAHILRDTGHAGKITLNVSRPKKRKFEFTVSDDAKDIFKSSSFYNLAASLQKCFIHHYFKDGESENSTLLVIQFVVTDTMAIELLDKYQKRLEVVEPKHL